MNPKAFAILHLSDAHIGNPLWTVDRKAVMRPLANDLLSYSAGNAPSLTVFSCDLVYGEGPGASMERQIEEARLWLDEIHQLWERRLGDIPLLIVPGNHDVQRSQIDEGQTSWLHTQMDSEGIERNIKTNSMLWRRILERQSLWWSFVKSIPKQPWNYDECLRMTSGRLPHGGRT